MVAGVGCGVKDSFCFCYFCLFELLGMTHRNRTTDDAREKGISGQGGVYTGAKGRNPGPRGGVCSSDRPPWTQDGRRSPGSPGEAWRVWSTAPGTTSC